MGSKRVLNPMILTEEHENPEINPIYVFMLQKPQNLEFPECSFGKNLVFEGLLYFFDGDKVGLWVWGLLVTAGHNDTVSALPN